MVVRLWKYRGLILRNSLNDLRHRFRGSVGGYLWNVFIPLAQIVVFSVIFGVLMDYSMRGQRVSGMPDGYSFVIFLCSGLLAWNGFAETLSRGVASLVANAGYLKKLPLPEQVFVAQDACTGFFSATIAISLFLLFSVGIAGYGPYLEWLQVIPALMLLMLFAYGLALMLSCINVFVRDLQPLIGIVLLLWFWLTPVVYMEDQFRNSRHEWFLTVAPLNPAYHFIRMFREAVFYHRWVDMWAWVLCAAIAVVTNILAYVVLRKLRSEIRDVL